MIVLRGCIRTHTAHNLEWHTVISQSTKWECQLSLEDLEEPTAMVSSDTTERKEISEIDTEATGYRGGQVAERRETISDEHCENQPQK